MKKLVAILLVVILLCACEKRAGEPEFEPSVPDEIGTIGEESPQEELLEETGAEPEPEAVLEKLEMTAEEAGEALKPDETGAIPIAKREDLAALAALVNAGETFTGQTFKLQNDISMSGYLFVPIGRMQAQDNDTSHAYAFDGTFDGQGYMISGLTARDDSGAGCAGLFGIVGDSGRIENLHIIRAEVAGSDMTGGLVGWNLGTIFNCSFQGTVTSNGILAGGLVGLNGAHEAAGGQASQIENSFCNAEVRGAGETGVFVGGNYAAVRNCYALGSVVSVQGGQSGEPREIGGFAGHNGGELETCFSSTEVYTNVASRLVGGFCGYSDGGIVSCYYNETATANWKPVSQSDAEIEPGIAGCTVDELVERDTYEGWDFDTVWTIDGVKNRGLPYLQTAGL